VIRGAGEKLALIVRSKWNFEAKRREASAESRAARNAILERDQQPGDRQ